MTDVYSVYPGEHIVAGVVTEDPELCFSIEEADSRIIPQITKACQNEVKRIVVMSNNTDVVICSLVYHQRLCELGIQELWVKFGIKGVCRNTNSQAGQQLGGEKCSALLKAHILTGCDVTSKIGTNVSAVASKSKSYLDGFGIECLRDSSFVLGKKYLMRVISPK